MCAAAQQNWENAGQKQQRMPDIGCCEGCGEGCCGRAAEEALVQVVQLQQLLADGRHHLSRQQRQHLQWGGSLL